MNFKIKLFLFLYFFSITINAQVVSGNLIAHVNQEITLEGFNGVNTYLISTTTIDSKGNFSLSFSTNDTGIGYLRIKESKPFWILLNKENVTIKGNSLIDFNSIQVVEGKQNKMLQQYGKEHQLRVQVLNAWNYLDKIYSANSLFDDKKGTKTAIVNEITIIEEEDQKFIKQLPQDGYLSWYISLRKQLGAIATMSQFKKNELQQLVQKFRLLNYSDDRLFKSGLLKDVIDSHFWILENNGYTSEKSLQEMKLSIDSIVSSLTKDEEKLNSVTDYLFDLLERHSLFAASEYLALKLLNEVSCTLDGDLVKQLETYRAMKKGNKAPDIEFIGDGLYSNLSKNTTYKRLTDIKSKFKLVVFGASWCPKCTEEIPEIVKIYPNWKSKDVEIVFISLDESKDAFQRFSEKFPFISISDLKKWESKIAKDYFVFATPTMYLLDSDNLIVLKPISAKQIDAWLVSNKY